MPTLITISLSANNAGSSKNHNSSKAGNSYSCCTPSSNKKDAGRVTKTSTTSTSAGRAGEEDHPLSINLSRDPGPSAITNATASSSTSAAVDTMNTVFSAASAAKRTSSASYSPVAFFADRLVEERIDALIEFNMKHGHSDVSEILAENPSLGNWCIYLREANKLKLVSEGNVQLLEKLGFDWNATNTGNQHASITPVVDLSRLYSSSKSAAIASSTREQELRFPHHTRTTSSRISLPSSASSNPPRIITGTMMHRMPLAPTLTRRMIATQLPASSARRMTDVAARVPGAALTATTRRLVAAATRAPPPAAAVAAPQYVYQHPNQYCVYQIATNKNIPMPAGEMVPPNFIPSPNTKNDTINNGQNNGYQQEREGTTTRSTIPQNPQQSAPLPVTKITKSSHLCGANHQGRVNMSEPSSQSFMVSSSSTSKVHIGQKRKYMHHQQEAPLLQFPIGLTFPSHQPPYLKSKNPVDNFGNASKAYIKMAVRSVVTTNISPSAAPGTLSCYGDHLTPIMGRRIVDFIPTKEKNLVTAYTLMVISQLKVCRFTLQQKVGKRKDVFVGFPGMQCLHCEDHKQRRSGAYFPTSVKTLSDSKKILYAIAKHINKCTACPLEVKYSIARALVIHEIQRRAEKRHGSQRAFFGEVWRILHPNDESSKEIINAMFRPSTNDQCFQNSNLVLSDAQQQEEVKSDQERSPNLTKKQQCAKKASVSAGLLSKVTTIPYSLCASSILQQHCAIVTVAPTSTEQLSEKTVIPASLPKSIMTDQQCATIVAPSSSTKQLSEISTTPVSLIVSITTEQHSATLVPPAFSKQRREKSTTPQ